MASLLECIQRIEKAGAGTHKTKTGTPLGAPVRI